MDSKRKKILPKWIWWIAFIVIALVLRRPLIDFVQQIWPSIVWNFELVKSLPNRCALIDDNGIAKGDIIDLAKCTEITRNFGWMLWMLLSVTGVGFGLWLTWRGRQTQDRQWKTQHESHLQERFEKAADMLSSETELTRIASCRSLMNLGKSDESMKSQCVQLLFAFIKAQIKDDEEDAFEALSGNITAFGSDIQQAIASFSAIYEHYNRVGVDDELVELPQRFWKNGRKPAISLIKANLRGVELRNARLSHANLQDAKLERANLNSADLLWANLRGINLRNGYLVGAYLQGADLHGADLEGVNILWADMQKAKNLTKKQILSAIWGYDEHGDGGPPQLPEDLMQEEDIKKWRETSTYDFREPDNPPNSFYSHSYREYCPPFR